MPETNEHMKSQHTKHIPTDIYNWENITKKVSLLTRDPLPTDDYTKGYNIFSEIVRIDSTPRTVWKCTDPAEGLAVWVSVGGGSGSGTPLTVQEIDDNPIGLNIDRLVFNGVDEIVTIVGTTAYINGTPPPANLGGALSVAGTTFYTGRTSQSNINYELPIGSIRNDIIIDTTFTLSKNTFANASIGNLVLNINGTDVANIDLAANFEEVNRSGSQIMGNYNTTGTGSPLAGGIVNFAGGNLTLNSVHWTNPIGSDVYQDGSLTISITGGALRQGYNYIDVSHNSHSTTTFKIFNDIDAGPGIDITIPTLAQDTPVLNHISGINYYDTGSTFDLDVIGAYLFNNVYHITSPLTYAFSWANSGILVHTDASVTGVSNPPDIGETMTVTGFPITVTANEQEPNAVGSVTPRDPYGSGVTEDTIALNFQVMSIADMSTRTIEYFVDENWRFPLSTNVDILPAATTGNWDSTALLGTEDLQVYNIDVAEKRCLYHPQIDYTGRMPAQTANYVPLLTETDSQYLRIFQGAVVDQSNGILSVPGMTDADLGTNIKIELKVPTKTSWIDLSSAYSFATFDANAALGQPDGEGCRINALLHSPDIDNLLEFSLGSYASDNSVNYLLWIKITYLNNTIPRRLETGMGITNW